MAFDLSAARAQRLEAKGATFDFSIDGETFSLPTELPLDVLDVIKDVEKSDIKTLVSSIMGDVEAAKRLFAHKLTVQDLKALLDEWGKTTGASVGEDSPSAA